MTAPRRTGIAGRSPGHGCLFAGAGYTPALPVALACRFWTRSDGRSTARLRSPMSAGRSPPPHLCGDSAERAQPVMLPRQMVGQRGHRPWGTARQDGSLDQPHRGSRGRVDSLGCSKRDSRAGSAPQTDPSGDGRAGWAVPQGTVRSQHQGPLYLWQWAARREQASVAAQPRCQSHPARRLRGEAPWRCRALREAEGRLSSTGGTQDSRGTGAPRFPSPAVAHRCCRSCRGSTWRRAGSACGVSGRRGRAGRPRRGPPPRRTPPGRSPRPRRKEKAGGGGGGGP